MARCIPALIEDMDEGQPERVFFDWLKAELPDEFVIIPSFEISSRPD
jgi:hypothetical protein